MRDEDGLQLDFTDVIAGVRHLKGCGAGVADPNARGSLRVAPPGNIIKSKKAAGRPRDLAAPEVPGRSLRKPRLTRKARLDALEEGKRIGVARLDPQRVGPAAGKTQPLSAQAHRLADVGSVRPRDDSGWAGHWLGIGPAPLCLNLFRNHERLAVFAGQVLIGFRVANAGKCLRIEVDSAANAVGNVG
jgi:hypothetical protein